MTKPLIITFLDLLTDFCIAWATCKFIGIKYIPILMNIVLDYCYLYISLCKTYPAYARFLTNIYLLALIFALWSNDLIIFTAFFTFTLSTLCLVYIVYIDVKLKKKHPFVCKLLLVILLIVITLSFFYFAKLSILYLKSAILQAGARKTPTDNVPENPEKTNGPNSSYKSDGPNGPNGSPPPHAHVDTAAKKKTDEEKKKATSERQKKWRRENAEKVKKYKSDYNKSDKRRKTQSEWEQNNADAVKSYKRKYNKSEKGVDTHKEWVLNNPDNIKTNSDKYSASDTGKLTKNAYYVNNKQHLNEHMDIRREENKDDINELARIQYHENSVISETKKNNSRVQYQANKDEINRKRREKRKEIKERKERNNLFSGTGTLE